MYKANNLKHFISFLLLMIMALAFSGNASADYASSCAGCHSPLASSNKKGRSASKIKSAIASNMGSMGSLSGLSDTTLNAIAVELGGAANLSITPPPVVCYSPQVRDAATNTCVTPACPTGQVRNTAGVCAAIPVTCTLPQMRDAATNTCVTPACPTGQVRNTAGVCEVTVTPVTCTLPEVLNATTNACETPACPTGQVLNAAGVSLYLLQILK